MTTCAVHPGGHSDEPESVDRHHVIPQTWWRSPKNFETVTVCPSGHRDIHVYLDLLVASHGVQPMWVRRRRFPKPVQVLATRGYTTAVAKGITPGKTL